jgi:hypothetical protein
VSDRIKVGAIIFLNRPGQNEKTTNFRGKNGIVCTYLTHPRAS